ncbi:serpin family protein [Hymenobacter cellulosilyticus]|uniref:Serpin family protein n=1 Tax=Hymenobacter cellulosilyticus TaxID=2932248 RepID=A0A8T9QDS8_9BACT|nr:serpin family protein [Hymenobacter cellulosilyticus]UOQ74298.1 serpin family protein [Hymenobacter cellulosilyticus]
MNLTHSSSWLGLLTGSLLLFTACQKEDAAPAADDSNEPVLRALTDTEAKTVNSSNDFAFRSFAALHEQANGANVFMSPLSISSALTMVYNGADGTTKEAMRQTLGFQPQTDQQINQAYQSLTTLLRGMDKRVTFGSANSIWYNQQYQLQLPFVQTNAQYFDATVRGMDFGAASTAETINAWVREKTQGKIDGIVEGTSADQVMILVNAIYFKGAWAHAFDKALTRPAAFTRADGTTATVDFMTQSNGQYGYYQDADRRVIDIPYGNGQYSLTVVVPQGNATVKDVVRSLNGAQLTTWLAAAKPSSWTLRLPRFKMQYKKELGAMLAQLGMGEAFSSQANFSRMLSNSSARLAISEVQHKTYLDVNEEGTEAAAVTSVGVINTSVPPVVSVDRACVFLIREKSTNAILFMGQLMNP